MPRRILFGIAMIAMSLALGPDDVRTVLADGPDSGPNPEGNLADMNGSSNPARVWGQVINGTVAHVKIKVSTDGTYVLKNPGGSSSWTQTSDKKDVLFQSIPLTDGWWKLEDVLGSTITRYEVVTSNGSLVGAESHQVVTMSPEAFANCTLVFDCYGPYALQDVVFHSANQPKCSASGQNDSNVTVFVELGQHNKVRFTYLAYTNNLVVPDVAGFLFARDIDLFDVELTEHEYWLQANTLLITNVPHDQPDRLTAYGFFRFVHDVSTEGRDIVRATCFDVLAYQLGYSTPFQFRAQVQVGS